MRERARILDSRYLEFIEYLQKLGELQSLSRMIIDLSHLENDAWKRSETGIEKHERDASKMMYSFWQRGWIEIRETEKKDEKKPGKEYSIRVRLKKITEYFREESIPDRPDLSTSFRDRRHRCRPEVQS
jgi:predicted transcriptional regulator